MRIITTNEFFKLPDIANDYHDKKVSKVKVIKDGIKMERSLNKKEKVCFIVSSFSREKFYNMKSTVFNKLGKLSNSLGIENKFAERKDEALANKKIAAKDKAKAKSNKRIVKIMYVDHKTATKTVDKQMKKLAAQITINSSGLTGTDESVAKQKLEAYFSLVEASDSDMEKIKYLEEAAAGVASVVDDNQLRARTYSQLGELYEHLDTVSKDDAIAKAKDNYEYALAEDINDMKSIKGLGRIALNNDNLEDFAKYLTREFKLLNNNFSSIRARTTEIYSELNEGEKILNLVINELDKGGPNSHITLQPILLMFHILKEPR